MPGRTRPNIIITGTPGVGKTSHARALAQATGLRHVCVSEFAIANKCCDEWDDRLQTWEVDDDKLLDAISPLVAEGGNVIDWHCSDLFEEQDIDIVIVLHADTDVLFDRLVGRGYSEAKITENMDSEIMMVVEEEARASFTDEGVVHVCQSNTADEMQNNVDRLMLWTKNWIENNSS